MSRKRWKHPLDVKTGRLAFTPVLRSTGERLALEVDYETFPRSKAAGFHGNAQDLKTGKWFAVYGKECDIPGCHCDAWVEDLAAGDHEPSRQGGQWKNQVRIADDFDQLPGDIAPAFGTPPNGISPQIVETEDGILGSMRDYADEMDEIVEDAMRRRRISAWLPTREDLAALEAISQATGQPLNALLDEALRQFLRLRNDRTLEGPEHGQTSC